MQTSNTNERIAWLLAASGLTHERLAHAVGVRRETVTQWSSGARACTRLIQVADVFGVTTDWLLAGRGPVPIEAAVRAVAQVRAPAVRHETETETPEGVVTIDRDPEYDQRGDARDSISGTGV